MGVTTPDGDALLTERLATALEGRYSIENEVGRGGMGQVYRARDLRHDRDVAVKILDPELAHTLARDRFEREIQVCAGLNHPNILPLLDSGHVDGIPFYVTPLVEGPTLRQRIDSDRQLEVEEALRITREVGSALTHAHASGVVHRDIKPSNILLSSGHAIVADFGVAQAIRRAGGDTLTRSGYSVGTPTYMSPEQATGERDIDARSDLYSLACVTYEMLTGSPPFSGRTAQVIVARHLAETPSSVRIVRPTVPKYVDEAVTRALAKVPADRFSTVAGFVSAFDHGKRVRPTRRRSVWTVGASVAVLAITSWAVGRWATWSRALDPEGVVVFPLVTEEEGGQTGEGIASLLGYLLDDTEPLHWIEGWYLLDPELRESPTRLDAETARRLAARAGAAHFVTGRVVATSDSVTVVLNLHDARDGAVVARTGTSGTRDEPASGLALRAVPKLLLPLLEPGRTVDPSLLAERDPAALTNFYQGESAYRRGHFETALDHYYRALNGDEALVLAALRAAEAATWLKRLDEARATAHLAATRPDLLPGAYGSLAMGLDRLLQGHVDSAIVALERHVAERPSSTDGWTALGEAYLHHFPSTPHADQHAIEAFRHAVESDPGFVPASYHLLESQVIRGDPTTDVERWTGERASSIPLDLWQHMQLVLSCDPGGTNDAWREALTNAGRNAQLSAAFVLSVGRGTRPCATEAVEGVVADTSLEGGMRFAALEVLGASLLADGLVEQAHERTSAAGVWSEDVRYLHLAWDVASGQASREGTEVSDGMSAQGLGRFRQSQIWLFATWNVAYGSVDQAVGAAAELARRAAESGETETALLATAVQGQIDARQGRTGEAIETLGGLRVEAPVDELQWSFWVALYPERLLLARLLTEQGNRAGATKVIDSLEQTYPRTALGAAFIPAVAVARRSAETSRD